MQNAVKYTYNVKTKTMLYTEYKNVERIDKDWILQNGSSPIKNKNIGKICTELTYVEDEIKKPYILALVLPVDNAETHMKLAKKAFENYIYNINATEGGTEAYR